MLSVHENGRDKAELPKIITAVYPKTIIYYPMANFVFTTGQGNT